MNLRKLIYSVLVIFLVTIINSTALFAQDLTAETQAAGSIPEPYFSKIKQAKQALEENWSYDKCTANDLLFNTDSYYYSDSDQCFALDDLNGDGVQELIFFISVGNRPDKSVNCVYTVINNNLQLVTKERFGDESLTALSILQDGSIFLYSDAEFYDENLQQMYSGGSAEAFGIVGDHLVLKWGVINEGYGSNYYYTEDINDIWSQKISSEEFRNSRDSQIYRNLGSNRIIDIEEYSNQGVPYDLNSLTFNFVNNEQGFGYYPNYKYPIEAYQYCYSEAQANFEYEHQGEWHGNCYGMCATTGMLNVQNSGMNVQEFNSSAKRVYDLKPKDVSSKFKYQLVTLIEALQVSQGLSRVQESKNSNHDLNTLIHSENAEFPIIIEIFGSIGGHALIATSLERVDSSTELLHVYDPNYPATDCFLTLKTDSNGNVTNWHYRFSDKYDFSGRNGESIDYIPYSVYHQVWLDMDKSYDNKVITVYLGSRNFNVKNQSGDTVATVRDGELSTNNPSIYKRKTCELTSISKSSSENDMFLYLPVGTYKIENMESGNLNLGVVNVQQSLDLTTEASNATITVDDSKNTNIASFDLTSGQYYEIELNSYLSSAKGKENIKVSGTGNGDEVKVGTTNGEMILENTDDANVVINNKEESQEPTKKEFTISTVISPIGSGTVTGSGTFEEGESVSLTAVPNDGYKFVSWSEDGSFVSSSDTYTFTAKANRTLKANFEKVSSEPSIPSPPSQPSTQSKVLIYRLYNSISGEHLYTSDQNEYNVLPRVGWTQEGVGWNAPNSGTAVYRLYNPALADHLYTTDENEVRVLTTERGWQADNGGRPLFYSGGSVPVYRLYHEGIRRHLLTRDENENTVLGGRGWTREGVGLRALS